MHSSLAHPWHSRSRPGPQILLLVVFARPALLSAVAISVITGVARVLCVCRCRWHENRAMTHANQLIIHMHIHESTCRRSITFLMIQDHTGAATCHNSHRDTISRWTFTHCEGKYFPSVRRTLRTQVTASIRRALIKERSLV